MGYIISGTNAANKEKHSSSGILSADGIVSVHSGTCRLVTCRGKKEG
jgi:hypothetical protein